MIYYYFTCKLYINIIKEHVRSNHYYFKHEKKLNNRKSMPNRYKNKNKNFKPTKTINNQQKITIKISTPNLQFIHDLKEVVVFLHY